MPVKCEVCGERWALYAISRPDFPEIEIKVCEECKDGCTFEFITFPLLQVLKGGKNE